MDLDFHKGPYRTKNSGWPLGFVAGTAPFCGKLWEVNTHHIIGNVLKWAFKALSPGSGLHL